MYVSKKKKKKKSQNKGFLNGLGHILTKGLPIVIKVLGVVGTVALLLVSGGIFHHYIEVIHHWVSENIPANIPEQVPQFGLGVVFGLVAVLGMMIFKKIVAAVKPAKK